LLGKANLQVREDTKMIDEQEFTEFLEKTYSDEMNNFIDNVKEISNKVVTTEVIIDGNGNIRFELSPYAEALQGVNISRLRVCDICEKFFWASRKDTFACSKKHSKVRQMRLLRENWKDKGDLYLKARQKKTNKKKEK